MTSEEMVGVCGVCQFTQSYTYKNMIPMDWDDEWMATLPDVHLGDSWFCQGCGSSTSYAVTVQQAKEVSE
tara:strand:+ start:12004 stop:12213 length:210 start_codon:yes stop_codon:yes gene_type:complete